MCGCVGKVLLTMRECNADDVNTAVCSARDVFKSWSQLSGMQRGKLLMKAAHILRVSDYVLTADSAAISSHSSISFRSHFQDAFWIFN